MEINFDGLVGPTHNYAGLGSGNLASINNAGLISSPSRAALQGLDKMRYLYDLGLPQGIIPPQPRPAQGLQAAFYSASSMWCANAATVSPSLDCADRKIHISIANLVSSKHRSIEASYNYEIFKQIFQDPKYFEIHAPLAPEHPDEGAANHCRFSAGHTGIEMFVYGHSDKQISKHYPSRQSLSASQLIASQHLLDMERCVFAQQNPDAIDAGVFHNDVISTSHLNVFLYHELAFTNTESVIGELQDKWSQIESERDLYLIAASESELSLEDAVKSYLYNSQIVSLAPDDFLLLAPQESQELSRVRKYIEKQILGGDNPIKQVKYIDLRESMRNGGGPACLRLRLSLSETEFQSIKPSVIFTEDLYKELKTYISKHYREELSPSDLTDHNFIEEALAVTQGIWEILALSDKSSYLLFEHDE